MKTDKQSNVTASMQVVPEAVLIAPTWAEPAEYLRTHPPAASPVSDGQSSTHGQLRIEFSVLRIVTVIFVAIGIIILILVSFKGNGVSLTSFRSTEKSDADLKKLLDTYNSLSGNLMSAVIKLVDMVLQLTVAVTLLCYAADWTIRRDASNMFTSMAPSLLAAAFSFLVCNGPTALNVQPVHGATFIRIVDADLSSQGARIQSENVTVLAGDSAYAENVNNNSVLNTILRTHLLPVEAVSAKCYAKWFGSFVESPRVSFGYPSADWMLKALPTMPTPDKTAALLSTNSPNVATSIDDLPVDLFSARTLYVTALEQLYEKFKGFWGISEADAKVNGRGGFFPLFLHDAYYATYAKWTGESADNRRFPTSGPQSSQYLGVGNLMDFAGDDFVNASRYMLQNLVGYASDIVAADVTAEYELIQVTDTLVYTALTLTIPVNATNEPYEFVFGPWCTPEGCVIPDEAAAFGNTSAAVMPGVRASALCNSTWPIESMNFDKRNCALVLVSIGKKITGGTLEANSNGNAVATSLRTVFTLTIGMLNWTIEDLGTTYNANCGVNITDTDQDGCIGIRVETPALQEAEKVLLLGVDELYMGELSDLTEVLLADDYRVEVTLRTYIWKPLVTVDSAPAILLPRNFEVVGASVETEIKSQAFGCPLLSDHVIRDILVNHLFAEESLQVGFTSALHYLLKDGVLHTISLEETQGHSVVEFLGNYQIFHVQVSIPQTNILISYAGCGLLAAIAIWVAVAHKRAKRIIEAEAANSVSVVAEALLNADKYPRSVLKLSLDKPALDGGASSFTKLDDLEFTSTVFTSKPAGTDWSEKLSKSTKAIRGIFPRPTSNPH